MISLIFFMFSRFETEITLTDECYFENLLNDIGFLFKLSWVAKPVLIKNSGI